MARKLGVHRRMVRAAVRNAVAAQRKKIERPAVKMASAAALIDSILESDRKAPRKQRHTARRIFDRIHAEVPGCTPPERTVREYVERRRRELGLAVHETFVPQSYDWGVEAQVDWYEAYADLDGERVKLYVFSMRSMASGAAFTGPIRARYSRLFLKRTSWRSRTSKASSVCFVTITCRVGSCAGGGRSYGVEPEAHRRLPRG